MTFVLGVAAAGGVFVGWHLNAGSPSRAPTPSTAQRSTVSPTPPAPVSLDDDFQQLQDKLHAQVGMAVAPLRNGNSPLVFGDWQTGPAWSTIKVPLVIAAYRETRKSPTR